MFVGQLLFFIVPENIACYVLNSAGMSLIVFLYYYFCGEWINSNSAYQDTTVWSTMWLFVGLVNFYYALQLQAPFWTVFLGSTMISVSVAMVAFVGYAAWFMSGFPSKH